MGTENEREKLLKLLSVTPRNKKKMKLNLLFISAVLGQGQIFQEIGNGNVAKVKDLISNGQDINQRGSGGQTPLMNAVLSGQTEVVKALLELGADHKIPEKDGYTPMHGAGFQGRAEIAKILIAHGLDASDRHNDGYTPIHRACWGREARHTETVRAFIDAGVDPNEANSQGKTCSDMTQNDGTRKLLKKLKEKSEL